MKNARAVAFFACMLLPGVARAQSDAALKRGASEAVSQAVRRQLTPLLDELMLAANAHDTDRFLAAYLHQPSLVMVFDGVVTKGWDNVRALQLKWWNNGVSDVVYSEPVSPEITVLDRSAAVVTQQMTSTRTLTGGGTSTGKFAVTMVWQRLPEGWRIVQVHESTVR